MARLNIEEGFFGDGRFDFLATLAGEHRFMTESRIQRVWMFCCYKQVSEYALKDDIDLHAVWTDPGQSYADLMVKARLADPPATPSGLYRIHGVDARIEYLRNQAERGKMGAQARILKANANPEVSKRLADAKQTLSECMQSAKHQNPTAKPTSCSSSCSSSPSKEKPQTTPPRRGGSSPSAFDFQVADAWIKWGLEIRPSMRPNREVCANVIRLMRTEDKLEESSIQAIFDFVKGSDFWRRNALSPASLRTARAGGLRKFENILNQIDKQRPGSSLESWAMEAD